jgi:hypothetical protein
MLFKRMQLLIDGEIPAAALFSGSYYFSEQLGLRKIIDTTFMIATMITGDTEPAELRKCFRVLQRAQRDIDLRPEAYTHFYRNEFPVRFHPQMDTKRWGPGERIVFEPYTEEAFSFGPGGLGDGTYQQVIACRLQTRQHDRRLAGPTASNRDQDHGGDFWACC